MRGDPGTLQGGDQGQEVGVWKTLRATVLLGMMGAMTRLRGSFALFTRIWGHPGKET